MSGGAVQYKEPMSEKSGKLAGWGRHAVDASEERTEDLVAASERAPLFRGLGRPYGDSSLPPEGEPRAVNTTLADRILAFHPETGLLRAEAGLSLFEFSAPWCSDRHESHDVHGVVHNCSCT